jgi:uncharacterized hydrophobic protein (TIGR00271 family)
MLNGLFNNISNKDKNEAIELIIKNATPRKDFFLMLVLSVGMATFGILLDSIVILVGSMLIAPLLYPILSFSLGIILTDEKLIGRSFYTVIKSIFYGLCVSFIISFFFYSRQGIGQLDFFSSLLNASHSIMYAFVAAIAGFAAAFAMTKPHLNNSLPGVAISVSLVPPLAATGIALSSLNWVVFSGASMLFTVNIIGIIFSAMIVFAMFKFGIKKTIAKEVIKEEEKLIFKESEEN